MSSFLLDFRVNESTENGPVLSAQFPAEEITQDVFDTGMVAAYFDEQDTWTAMPYTYGVESQNQNAVDYTLSFGYAYFPGTVEIFYEASAPFALDFAVDRLVKVVVMSNKALRKSAVDPNKVDWSNYEEVARAYNLPEPTTVEPRSATP